MAKRNFFVDEELADNTTTENATTNSTDEFTDFMDIDSDQGVQPDPYDETDDAESLPSTSDMSWSPTDNSTTFFDISSKPTNNETDNSTQLTEDSLEDFDSDTDSSSDTFFEDEENPPKQKHKALFKQLFGEDDEDEDDQEDEGETSNKENIDDETDEDQPLVSNLSEYYVADDTDTDERDDSEFHMVFKKLRLNK